ncbi:MAG: 5'-nucleotidase C-terminal domain-containing protein, partial [Lachnospiraceae bacterium]|nr:5'-nucleotidase C-terminal domain-containing protein [Lachnospiraceae bacterium]
HIDMDEAEVVNGIPLAQSSYGTTHVGRFDLTVDGDKGGILDWTWRRVPLTEKDGEFDLGVDDLADRVTFQKKKKRDNTRICEFEKVFEHKSRLYETDLGNLVADVFAKCHDMDFVILQSGSIRRKECGPVVTQKDLNETYPYDDKFVEVDLTGKEIKDAFQYLFSLKPDGSVMNGTFLYSKGFQLIADGTDCWQKGCSVVSLTLNGKEFEDDKVYRVGMTSNCASNCMRYFQLELGAERQKVLSLSTYHDLARWCLGQKDKIPTPETGRFIFQNFAG